MDPEPEDEGEEILLNSDSEPIMPSRKTARSRTTEAVVALEGAVSLNTTVLAVAAGDAEYTAQVSRAVNTPNPTATAPGYPTTPVYATPGVAAA